MKISVFLLSFIALLMAQDAFAQVVISEVMWMGSDLSTADEWIEMTVGSEQETVDGIPLDIGGWVVTTRKGNGEEGVIIEFPAETTLAKGEFLLISNFSAENSRLSSEPDFVTTAVSLPNTKLLLRLYNASGALVDEIDDGVGAPFAGMNASGSGSRASMERIDLSGSGSLKSNWRTAMSSRGFDTEGTPLFGTPGFANGTSERIDDPIPDPNPEPEPQPEPDPIPIPTPTPTPNPIPIPTIIITEILANPIGSDDEEWIELFNAGSGSIDLTNIVLEANGTKKTLSGTGAVLESGSYIVLSKVETGLPLRNASGSIAILLGDHVLDQRDYPEAMEGVSFGLVSPDDNQVQHFCIPTPGAENTNVLIDPQIDIQSGDTEGQGSVSINLQTTLERASMESISCSWDYGDGFTSESCNPPSHTFKEPGTYEIQLTVDAVCSQQHLRTLTVKVSEEDQEGDSPSNDPPKDDDEQSDDETKLFDCTPYTGTGLIISEFLPNPFGEELEQEWIELWNSTSEVLTLCGRILDDIEEGSKQFEPHDITINPNTYFVLKRSITKIALNNDSDEVRWFLGDTLLQSIPYRKAPEGESYALRSDGQYVWTPYPTPGSANRFRTAERRFDSDTVIVSAVLPNPVGKDREGEWVEITNVSDQPVTLDGWALDNKEGGSKPFSLDGITLDPKSVRRFRIQETGISLTNAKDSARLLDPDGYAASILSWTEAVSGRIYRPPVLFSDRIPAQVERVIDGDTIDVSFGDLRSFTSIPDSLRRRWKGIQEKADASIRVRLIGVDTPETKHPNLPVQEYGNNAYEFVRALIEEKKIELQFDTEVWDKYERLLAYVYLEDGQMLQELLLRHGLARAYLRFPFAHSSRFEILEGEAIRAQLGMWTLPSSAEVFTSEDKNIEENPEVEDVEKSAVTGSFVSELELQIVLSDSEPSYGSGVIISEIYPSPHPDEHEWIEFFNFLETPFDLSGWILDDKKDGGSKPWLIPDGTFIPPRSFFVLSSDQFSIKLNNTGDDVWLIAPDDSFEVTTGYPKLKKGFAYALQSDQWCITEKSTPGTSNVCEQEVKTRKASGSVSRTFPVKRSKMKRSVRPSGTTLRSILRTRYRNVPSTPIHHEFIDTRSSRFEALLGQEMTVENQEDWFNDEPRPSSSEPLIISLLTLPAIRFLFV